MAPPTGKKKPTVASFLGPAAMMGRRRSRSRSGSDGGSSSASEDPSATEVEWEMRPGGMLVQKRTAAGAGPGGNAAAAEAAAQVRVRVSFASARYEVRIGSRSTFGELKKLLTTESGLQPGDQRLLFRGKERENGEYLDRCGVKDRSKLVLTEDPTSQERRYIEMQRNAKIQSIHRAISNTSMDIDKLADQVTSIEKSISDGNKVAEVQITTLIELLMRQAIKLDSIPAEGDTSSLKNIQAKRVQKCVETLDVLKISNAKVKPVVVTTKWETFETPATSKWEFFD